MGREHSCDSAEVKQETVSTSRFEKFAADLNRRGALGMIVALNYSSPAVRARIEDFGVRAMTQRDLLDIVLYRDPIKQGTAIRSLFYYLDRVE